MRSAPYRLRNWHAATGLLHERKLFVQCGFAVLAQHRQAREWHLRTRYVEPGKFALRQRSAGVMRTAYASCVSLRR